MIGATVKVQGSGHGTVTDIDGHFRLTPVKRGATLEFSYMGYLTQTRKADGRAIVITLQPDTKALEEVVVIAYGQQKKLTITGAVSAVGGEELLKAPVPNVENALQGRLPGISVVQGSGMPGEESNTIRVRGIGSLNSAEPLVLVDGVERPSQSLGQHSRTDDLQVRRLRRLLHLWKDVELHGHHRCSAHGSVARNDGHP